MTRVWLGVLGLVGLMAWATERSSSGPGTGSIGLENGQLRALQDAVAESLARAARRAEVPESLRESGDQDPDLGPPSDHALDATADTADAGAPTAPDAWDCVTPESWYALALAPNGDIAVAADQGLVARVGGQWRRVFAEEPETPSSLLVLAWADDGLLIWLGDALWQADFRAPVRPLGTFADVQGDVVIARHRHRTAVLADGQLAVAERDGPFQLFPYEGSGGWKALDLSGPTVQAAVGEVNTCGSSDRVDLQILLNLKGNRLRFPAWPVVPRGARPRLADGEAWDPVAGSWAVLGAADGWFYLSAWEPRGEHGIHALWAIHTDQPPVRLLEGEPTHFAGAGTQRSAVVAMPDGLWRLRGSRTPERLTDAPQGLIALADNGRDVLVAADRGLQRWSRGTGWQAIPPSCPVGPALP